jgi:hypothetical protein
VRAILPYNDWKIRFFILGIKKLHLARGSAADIDWLLGKANIMPKCPGNARF